MFSRRMKILAIAAESQEISSWLNLCPQLSDLDWPVAKARQARWNGATLYALTNGPGPRLAKESLRVALEKAGPFDTIMSVGLCGALHPALSLQAVCTASEVGDGHDSWPALPVPGAQPFKLLSIDKFLADPAEKKHWAARGFGIVEMEAAPLAQFAAESKIPFRAVKIVSDLAHEHFTLDFNSCRDHNGRFERARILRAALGNPFRGLPDIFRLATRGFVGSETLRTFLAHANF